ncbi:MAG: hypothetical protein UH211_06390 [Agathobacter sp.]|nr:hypothetical protein [Agathobacter sp.]
MNKEDFIREFMNSPKPTSTDKAIPFLMKYIREAHQHDINFTKDEIKQISESLCKDLPPEDQQQIKKAMKILKI